MCIWTLSDEDLTYRLENIATNNYIAVVVHSIITVKHISYLAIAIITTMQGNIRVRSYGNIIHLMNNLKDLLILIGYIRLVTQQDSFSI